MYYYLETVKRSTLRSVFLFALLLISVTLCISVKAQQQDAATILQSLSFESYKKYIRPTEGNVYIWTKPNVNSPKVMEGSGSDKWAKCLQPWDMQPVLSENQAWYETPLGWVNKKVARPTVNGLISDDMLNTNQCGEMVDMDMALTWRVYSPIGSAGLAVADLGGAMLLGKLVDNVFVFKYRADVYIQYDNDNPNRLQMHSESNDGVISKTLYVGTKFCKPATFTSDHKWSEGDELYLQTKLFDLSKLNDKLLLYIFKDVIESNKTDYFYINSQMLSGTYSGVNF